MASLDVTSLYTNVLIQETIDIVVNSLFDNQNTLENLNKSQFKKLLEVCVKDNNFIFNGEHYVQHEGFAMGSPLSAPMANIFLSHHEINWLNDCPWAFKPLLYRRYVDDTFLVFRKREHVDLFCDYLNGKHPNIQFTKEYESEHKLSFLDMNIFKKENGNLTRFGLNIFRKKTFTGLGLNFHSHTFYNFKINNIKTLVVRAYRLCSTWYDFHKEIEFLRKYFKNNGFPETIVYTIINSFLRNVFSPKPIVFSAEKLLMYVKMPFLSIPCCNFIKKEIGYFFK